MPEAAKPEVLPQDLQVTLVCLMPATGNQNVVTIVKN
jgi:hypothetical protein